MNWHRQFKYTLSKRLSGLWTCSLEQPWQSRGKKRVKSLWTCRRKNTQSLHLFTLVPFLWGSYTQNNNSSSGDKSMRRWRQPARWWARPLKDSWLISFWLGEPCGATEATGWLLRLEHMSYRFPENCIFLDSWRRDSQTAAASSGQPAIATLAQSWNSSHDLKKRAQIKRGGYL